ncbi:crossover junction endodeoxyribonuclease RuvC [Peribacillus alkalitolerans]|uniref:crossover junction endodeoxyribonuclease RuvC n=1 Tax=Peribacillus alkalitolerans TaxID=1550385 RepID=UPI0013CF715E|nr:crossover junction endodeoxyribonuclease RuvC [Peribacillus alkalitolerans]
MTRFVGIDPSSKTGFVAIDQGGIVLRSKELTGVGTIDPKRMITLIDEVVAHVKPGDFICIEGFPFDTQKAMFAGGLHHGIRNELFKRNLKYYEVAPNAVKKFVNVTGWVGEPGSKRRLKDKEKKQVVMAAVKDHFGFEHRSDNVVDAYILAQIAWSITNGLTQKPYQLEVVNAILNPVTKAKKKAKAK